MTTTSGRAAREHEPPSTRSTPCRGDLCTKCDITLISTPGMFPECLFVSIRANNLSQQPRALFVDGAVFSHLIDMILSPTGLREKEPGYVGTRENEDL